MKLRRPCCPDVGNVEPVLVHRDGFDIERLGTEVEGALDLTVEPNAVRDAAVARVVDRPIEIASGVDRESPEDSVIRASSNQ